MVTVEAVDETGNRTTVTRNLTIDLSAPELHITSPAAGTMLGSATVDVTGTVADAHGTDRVTVNGVDAVLDGSGGFILAALALTEGSNTVIARAWDRAGNTGTRSIEVTVDTVPPRVTATVPVNGATGVPRSARPRVKFSEPVDAASLAGNIRLLHDSTVLPVTLSIVGNGAEVDVAPTGGLVDDAEHVLEVGAAITDRAGHPLEAAFAATFTTRDGTPPQPPILDPVASPACFTNLVVDRSRRARAPACSHRRCPTGDRTRPQPMARSASLSSRRWGRARSRWRLTAEDAAGNTSPPAYLAVELDCTQPRVIASEWNGDTTITVRYSEALDESTVIAGQSVVLDGSIGPITFNADVIGSTVTLAARRSSRRGPTAAASRD